MLRTTKLITLTLAGVALLMTAGSVFAQDLNSALKLTYKEQFDAADNAFSSLIKSEPANGKYYYYSGENQLASYFLDTANVSFKEVAENAIARFNQGIAAAPGEPLNYIGLGKVALIHKKMTLALEKFAKAESFLPVKKEKSVLTKPEQAQIYIRLAEAYIQVGSKDSALVFGYLRKAEVLDKKNPDLYLYRGDYWIYTFNDGSRAAENYKKSQDLAPQSARAKVRLGQLYTRVNSTEDALSYYSQALAIDSTFAPAYLALGFLNLNEKIKKPEEAKKYFKKYLDLSKNNIAAKRRYANMLIQTGDYTGAIKEINEIQVIDSVSYNDLNRALAYSYFEQKDYPKANFYINKFFRNSPVEKLYSKDYVYFGRILQKVGQDSLAITKLEQGYKIDTMNVDLLNEIAIGYTKMKKFESAAKTYQLKIDRKIGTGNDYFKMGLAYYNAQKYVEADSALSKLVRMNPDFEPAYLWKARVYSNLDPDSKEGLAKPYYEKLIEKASIDSVKYSKDLVEAYNYLGYYYLVNKKYCDSLDFWQKLLAIEPANTNAISAIKDLKTRCPNH
jgi:tetratricopeptide (TPR) repeat protein